MSKKAISISLAKVDYNLGKPHIYILADCPRDFEFWRFELVAYMLKAGKWETIHFDLSNQIHGQKGIVLNLPVENLPGVESPAMFRIFLKAAHVSPLECIDDIEDSIILSDIHGVYRNILHELMCDDGCNVSDEAIKQFLVLYAHEAAMAAGDLDIAQEMFKLAHANFSKCGSTVDHNCGCCQPKINTCGCHDRH